MITLVLGVALAAPPGWKVTEEAFDGCEISTRSEADAVAVSRAECEWKDVTLDDFNRQLTDWGTHDEIFSSVVDSVIREKRGDRNLVYQKHQRSGINDREVLMWATHEKVGAGDKYAWTTATDVPFEAAEGNVKAARHVGFWQAEPLEGGGIRVTYELHYDPAGSVPDPIVKAFQTGGTQEVLKDLHSALRGKLVG